MALARMTHGQLFGGIFGFGLAAQWAGIKNVWYNEIEHYPCEVVRARIADGSIVDKVKIYEQDIRTIGKHNLAPADIISAGVPCQPASVAGKRKGKDDDRWLWPETIRVVSELKPAVVICENPPGILSLDNGKAFDEVLIALEAEGYEIEIFNIPACSVGAWHKRERIWIIAYDESKFNGIIIPQTSKGQVQESGVCIKCPDVSNPQSRENDQRKRGNLVEKEQEGQSSYSTTELGSENVPDSNNPKLERVVGRSKSQKGKRFTNSSKNAPNTINERRCSRNPKRKDAKDVRQLQGGEGYGIWNTEPEVGRVAHGVPNRVDSLKGLGNAIVPRGAYEIFKAIIKTQVA